MTRPDDSLAPSRRSRRTPSQAATPTAGDYDEAELARGQAAAVLGALGRMQLKLEVMAREHAVATERLEAKVDALQATLDSLTVED